MVEETTKFDEQFINVMFDLQDEAQVSNNYTALLSILHMLEEEHYQSPYDYITKYIFDHDEIDNPDEAVITFTALKELYRQKDGQEGDFICTFLSSIERHIKLAIIQQKYIEKQTKRVNLLNSRISAKLRQTEISMTELEKSMSQMKIDKASIYTDFIAILGIFSALLFGLFVGFDVFKEFVAAMTATAKLSRSLIMGSLLLIGLVSLVFLLFEGIARLTDRNMKSCCKDPFCNHNIYQRYPVFFCSLLILVSTILVSTIVLVMNMEGFLYHSAFFVGAVIIFILLMWVIAGRMIFKPKELIKKESLADKKDRP